VTMTSIEVPASVEAWLAVPEVPAPWPAVVVVHDGLGMSRDLCNQADWLAEEGFLAAAPDLFGKRGRLACMISIMRQVQSGRGPVFDQIDAVRRWLAAREDCTGTVGIIGFCMGGGLALALAPGHGFAASSVNYGAASKAAYSADRLADACPIVASYGGKDPTLRGAAARLTEALRAAGVPHDVKEYPDVGHGFMNDHEGAGDELPAALAVMVKLMPGPGYDEAATQDARRRISAFFGQHLRG
jgi:carboxymethylenebutenolidase